MARGRPTKKKKKIWLREFLGPKKKHFSRISHVIQSLLVTRSPPAGVLITKTEIDDWGGL
jgi:hypothetical protein